MGVSKRADHINFRIIENSWLARMAAWKLKAHSVAIVFGNNIHLYNTSRQHFLHNDCWVKHELCHVRQFREHGFINFLAKYLWESIRKGYYSNKYEVEARAAEHDPGQKPIACLLN